MQHCLLNPEPVPLQLGYGVLGIVTLQRQGLDARLPFAPPHDDFTACGGKHCGPFNILRAVTEVPGPRGAVMEREKQKQEGLLRPNSSPLLSSLAWPPRQCPCVTPFLPHTPPFRAQRLHFQRDRRPKRPLQSSPQNSSSLLHALWTRCAAQCVWGNVFAPNRSTRTTTQASGIMPARVSWLSCLPSWQPCGNTATPVSPRLQFIQSITKQHQNSTSQRAEPIP